MIYGRRAEDGVTAPRSARTWGVVVYAGERRYFFPGGTPDVALALARTALPDQLRDPLTRIEFGNAEHGWAVHEVLREG
jgi:hypothetical protein